MDTVNFHTGFKVTASVILSGIELIDAVIISSLHN